MYYTAMHNMPIVMDVLPWPGGSGFRGGDAWWQYTLSQSERERLDNLLGLALLDKNVCEQLVIQRDPSLMAAFGLSEDTQHWLAHIEAQTLKDLAEAVLAASDLCRDESTSEAA